MNENLRTILESSNAIVKLEIGSDELKEFAKSMIAMGAEMEKKRMQAEETFISKEEVKKLLGVCNTTLWHWQRNGYLVPGKIGRKIMYSKNDVNKILMDKPL